MRRRAASTFSAVFALVSLLLIAAPGFLKGQAPIPPIPASHVRIHYFRPDGNYLGWTVYAFGDTTEDTSNFNGGPVKVTGQDSFGAFFDVGVTSTAQNVGFIIHKGNIKDPGPNEFIDPATQGNEYWQLSGSNVLHTTQPSTIQQTDPPIPTGKARIHYHRPDNDYANWNLFPFFATTDPNSDFCGTNDFVTAYDTYGAYYDVGIDPTKFNGLLGFIVHNISLGIKDPGPDMHLNVAKFNEAWVISGDAQVFTTQPTAAQLLDAVFFKQQAFWIDRATVAIQGQFLQSGFTYLLHYDPNANLQLTSTGVTGGLSIPLTPFAGGFTPDEQARFPQLSGYAVLHLPDNNGTSLLAAVLKGQVAVSATASDGRLKYVTSVQTAGVLDDLFFFPGELGVIFHNREEADSPDASDCDGSGAILSRVWAPTAQSLSLELFEHATDTTPPQAPAIHATNAPSTPCPPDTPPNQHSLLPLHAYLPTHPPLVPTFATPPYSPPLAPH